MNVHPLPVAMRNGELIPVTEATVPVTSSALYGALGVYETVEIVHGRPFHLNHHLSRLDDSARLSGFTLMPPTDQVAEWLPALLEANQADETLLRVVILDLGEGPATYYLYLMEPPLYPAAWYEHGVSVTTFEGERAFPLIKSLNTLVPGLARRKAKSMGAHDALLINHAGEVTEGSNCNIFAVIDGTLVTPPYGAALEGVTLTVVLELARQMGIPTQRRPLPAAAISTWDEAFLTSTRRHILPISRIDEQEQPVGPITRRLMRAFADLFQREMEAGRA
jgi:Branched-chain amino acid aminotransferase/4-amino-4-deoxychorismate lyase